MFFHKYAYQVFIGLQDLASEDLASIAGQRHAQGSCDAMYSIAVAEAAIFAYSPPLAHTSMMLGATAPVTLTRPTPRWLLLSILTVLCYCVHNIKANVFHCFPKSS